MAETSIKISLELADKAAQKALSDFLTKGEKGEQAFKKMGAAGTGTFDQIGISIGKATGFYDIFAGNLAANLATKAIETIASAASALFNTFIVDGVKAAMAQEDAINALNISLAQTGIYSKSTSQAIQDYAGELQNTTGISDDLILKNAALIQSIAQLDEKGLKKATGAALNLSAALGKDLGSASEALAKASNGNITALQKMGLTIERGRDNAETFANALKAVEDRFSGAAAGKAKTFSGAIAVASESFGDLTEEIGNAIVKNPVFIAAMAEGAKVLQELTAIVKESGPAIAQILGKTFIIVTDVVSVAITVFDAFVRIQSAGWRAIETYALTGALAIAKALNIVGLASDQTVATLKEQLNDKAKSVFKSFSEDTGLGKAAESVIRIGDAAERGFDQLQKGATGSVEPIKNTTKAVKALSEEQKQAEDRLRSFAIELIKSGESSKTQSEQELESARAKADMELATEQQLVNDRLITQSDFLVRKAEIDAEYETARMVIEDQKYLDDQVRLDDALAKKKISETEYREANLALDAKFRATTLKGEADAKKQKVKTEEEIKAQERRDQQYRLQSTASMFGGLAALAATGGKKMFEIAKAFNLAEAITSGVLSIQNAAASAPPPFNIPAIVGASAFAAANIIRISSTKAPSFADGGIVPGSSFSGDRVSANVNSGEMILNRAQQRTLFDVANGSGGDSSRVEALLGRLIGAIEGSPVVVNIGGRTVVDTIRSELAAGRSFA